MAIYVVSAFSLGMLPRDGDVYYLKVEEASLDYLREAIKEGAVVRIGHSSTASVLSRLVGERIEADRTPITVSTEDETVIIVFQVLQRPKEGQVYNIEEIEEIIRKGQYAVYRVLIVPRKITADIQDLGSRLAFD